MSKREIIRQFSIEAEIYDTDLAQKILEEVKVDLPEMTDDAHFGLDIVFDKSVYNKAEFFLYPITKEHKGPKPKTDEEKRKQAIYDVLSEQLDKTVKTLEELGFRFGITGIIGEEMADDKILVALYREEPPEVPKGKRKTHFRVNTIMPDRQFIINQAAKALADIFIKQQREERIKEWEKQQHTANWVAAGKLFGAIATALQTETADIEATKAKLIEEAVIESDFPLFIKAKEGNDPEAVLTPETQIDCPEYLIFRLGTGGDWNIRKIGNLQEAKQLITKGGLNTKRYKTMIVLHNEQVVPYALFAETDDGIVPVTQEEASVYKKLLVSWNNSKQG